MNSKIFGYIIFFSAVLIFLLIIFIDNRKSEEIKTKHDNFYYQEVCGIVYNITQNRGTIILRLKKEPKKKYYFGLSRNYELSPYNIEKFIQQGDSICKPLKSDKISIYRGQEEFYFIIDKTINKEAK